VSENGPQPTTKPKSRARDSQGKGGRRVVNPFEATRKKSPVWDTGINPTGTGARKPFLIRNTGPKIMVTVAKGDTPKKRSLSVKIGEANAGTP